MYARPQKKKNQNLFEYDQGCLCRVDAVTASACIAGLELHGHAICARWANLDFAGWHDAAAGIPIEEIVLVSV